MYGHFTEFEKAQAIYINKAFEEVEAHDHVHFVSELTESLCLLSMLYFFCGGQPTQ